MQQFHDINGPSGMLVCTRKSQVKEMRFETFPEGCNWTVFQKFHVAWSLTVIGCYYHRVRWCLWGKGQVKEMCFEMLLQAFSWSGWMDKQLKVVSKRKGMRVTRSGTCIDLDPSNQQSDSLVWSQCVRWEWWGNHWVKINRLFFTKTFLGQQTDLEHDSKFY